ncbi:MAG: hypothetical protein K0R57_2331 [Paenibacillaceae bacterium]|jgi:hypothetical protein|nr:hypothetical protein [Paenibacillaceae bacterium]
MITLFSKKKKTAYPEEIYEIEKLANAQDEISRILREHRPVEWPQVSNQQLSIFQRQF